MFHVKHPINGAYPDDVGCRDFNNLGENISFLKASAVPKILYISPFLLITSPGNCATGPQCSAECLCPEPES